MSALRAGGATFALGLGCLVLIDHRLPDGLAGLDGLSIAISSACCALLAFGICKLCERARISTVWMAALLAVLLTAMFWSGAVLPGESAGWRRFELPLLGVAFPVFLICAWRLLRDGPASASAILLALVAASPAAVLMLDDGAPFRAPRSATDRSHALDVANVRFTLRPDVYLVGFLGASPEDVLRQSLGLESSQLERAFDALAFRRFESVFTEAAPTRNAYDMLLGMTRDYVARIPEPARGAQFSGNHFSPLFELFRRNGYRITTLNADHKFGGFRGAQIDRYVVNRRYSLCRARDLFEDSIRPLVFFGACLARRSKVFPDSRQVEGPTAELLLETLAGEEADGPPRLFVAHLDRPGHAPSEQKLRGSPTAVARFARRYNERSLEAADQLRRILEAIRAEERDFVLFAFGDHGVGVLQKIAARDTDPVAILRDRLAVVAGVYPSDVCTAHLRDDMRTTAALLRGLVTCLAGGRDPWPADYEHPAVVDQLFLRSGGSP